MIAGCIGFFSSILPKIKDKLAFEKKFPGTYPGFPSNPAVLDAGIQQLDTSIYYMFVLGIFKDRRKEV